ncbi:MAG TPA: DUF1080 domain-containing protein [Terriglobia bacterium]|nr:DUF1080 domain-containing protein [Terriglobia bacterium]
MKTAISIAGVTSLVMAAALFAMKGAAAPAATGGWVALFPDKSFKGWTRVAIPPDHPLDPVSQWSVDPVKRFIVCEGNRGHEWLRYDRELADFELQVEWRFTRLAKPAPYNSGIFVRTGADGRVWYQAQIGSASGGFFFGDNPENGALKRFNLSSLVKENRVKEAGEWNTYLIRCQGKTLRLSVNGAVMSEFHECNTPRGYIGLEAEGYRIEFRNLRVRELP